MAHISVLLISERSELIAEMTQQLELEMIQLSPVARWQQAASVMEREKPQLILVDSLGSSVFSLSICREIRTRFQGLLMLLTGDSSEHLHTLALGMGVDCSLPGDVAPLLVVAQVKALLRRFVVKELPQIQTFGDLTVDSSKRDVFIADQAAQLSTLEFNLFWTLVEHAGSVVSRDDIHRALYNSPYNGYDRGIDIYVSRIRQKIGDDPTTPRYLKTVRGAGYQFVAVSDLDEANVVAVT